MMTNKTLRLPLNSCIYLNLRKLKIHAYIKLYEKTETENFNIQNQHDQFSFTSSNHFFLETPSPPFGIYQKEGKINQDQQCGHCWLRAE